jgi:predicted Zn-dependent protease
MCHGQLASILLDFTARNMRRMTIRILICTLSIGLSSGPVAGQSIAKPELFEKSQVAALQALAYYGPYDNPKEQRRVNELGYRIAQESGFEDFPFTFYLIDMPEPNAFALPGGQVFVTRGMLNLGLTDDMLAGLLGHEIGHVVLQHGTRMQRRATLLNVLSQALLAGVMIAASQSDNSKQSGPRDPYPTRSQGGDLIQGTAAAGAVLSELLLRSYSRGFEDESDDEGQRMAAAAGFDPEGTRQLMDKMRTHMPQSKEYGYWRTHPFFEERVQAAAVRQELLKIKEPAAADEYRARTQKVLLDFLDQSDLEPPMAALLQRQTLLAWPQGPAADQLRLELLHAQRELQTSRRPMSQEWRQVMTAYETNIEEIRELTPDSPLLATLEGEVQEMDALLAANYPQATEILQGGIYETEFLETFLSNYPDSAETSQVSLALGQAYARLDREEEAVDRFLHAWKADPESTAGQTAIRGLRTVTPRLKSLGALEQLVTECDDPTLREAADQRLATLARSFDELANGADYLKRYPSGQQADVVTLRLDQLADELYGELVLYQSVGDHVKGIERIQQILTHAPNSPAAERLREKMVLEG